MRRPAVAGNTGVCWTPFAWGTPPRLRAGCVSTWRSWSRSCASRHRRVVQTDLAELFGARPEPCGTCWSSIPILRPLSVNCCKPMFRRLPDRICACELPRHALARPTHFGRGQLRRGRARHAGCLGRGLGRSGARARRGADRLLGDPGLLALRESGPVPVTGLAEAAFVEAARHGRFAVVTGGARWGPMLQRLAQALGYAPLLSGVHTVVPTGAQLAADPAAAVALLADACRDTVRQMGVQAVILGGAGLAGMAAAVQPGLGVPVIDSVLAGARWALRTHAAASARGAPGFDVAWSDVSPELAALGLASMSLVRRCLSCRYCHCGLDPGQFAQKKCHCGLKPRIRSGAGSAIHVTPEASGPSGVDPGSSPA